MDWSAMKLCLIVTTPGKMEGKTIPVTLTQFLVGRDPQCHLRPASPMVSKRHCLITTTGTQITIRDFNSTNGTFVNDQKVDGETELRDGDELKIGPLAFRVSIEVPATAMQAIPVVRSAAGIADDNAAALLLDGSELTSTPKGTVAMDSSQEIPTGSTIMETMDRALPPEDPNKKVDAPNSGGGQREKAAKEQSANTSTAAKAILEKYMRRTRS